MTTSPDGPAGTNGPDAPVGHDAGTAGPDAPVGHDAGFLKAVYKCTLGWALAGLPLAGLLGGIPGITGFGFGALSIGIILGMWDLTLRFTLGPRQTNTAWESLLVFLRYGLLGGLFYAIISWFAVSLAWFVTGATVLIPGMLTALLTHKEEARSPGAED